MVRRALVFLPRCIGDTLLATPLLRQLKRLHPDVELHVVCAPLGRSILRHNSHIDELVTLRRGRQGTRDMVGLVGRSWLRRYDLVIDMYAQPKTALLSLATAARHRHGFQRRWPRNHMCYTNAMSPGKYIYAGQARLHLLNHQETDLNDLRLEFPTSDEDQAAGREFCGQHFRQPVAAMATFSTGNRYWPVEKWAAIGKRLQAEGMQIYLLHGPGERPECERVAEAIGGDCIVDYPTQSLPLMVETLRACSLYVGHDCGPKHMANAAGLPTVSLFGTVVPEQWTEPHRSDQRFVAPHSDREAKDWFGEFDAVDVIGDITVDAVWRQVESLFELGHVDRSGRRGLLAA